MSDMSHTLLDVAPQVDAESNPRVSVIMANYNGAAHLTDALSSALSQTVTDIEVIVVDDASTDHSADLADQVAKKDSRVKVHRAVSNGGPGAARNRALDVARGDWIAVMDGDDLMHPRRLEFLLDMAELHQADAIADDLIYFTSGAIGDGKTLLGDQAPEDAKLIKLEDMLRSENDAGANSLGYLKPLIRRSSLGAQRYRRDIRIGEDFDFYLRFVLSGAKFVLTSQSYYLYRRHAGSVSHRLAADDLTAMIRAQTDIQDEYRFLSETINAMFDKRRQRLEQAREFEHLVSYIKNWMFISAVGCSLKTPQVLPKLGRAFAEHLQHRRAAADASEPRETEVVLLSKSQSLADFPLELGAPKVLWIPDDPRDWTARDWAKVTACTGQDHQRLFAQGAAGANALGFVPNWQSVHLAPEDEAWDDQTQDLIKAAITAQKATDGITKSDQGSSPIILERAMTQPALKAPARQTRTKQTKSAADCLVHIRTPTYNRTDALRRCLLGMQTQSHENWICEVFDDSPDATGRKVVEELADPRIRYVHNSPRRFASKNIDGCFSKENPHNADYFCVVEDDNLILPTFLEENIDLCLSKSVEVVFRNQLVEFASGTEEAHLSEFGILDEKLTERIYAPDVLRMALLADIGVSNGGLFWSRFAKTDFEIHHDCSATLQEYLRTFAIVDPVYVALKPLAVWAENGTQTTRDQGAALNWFKRELSLKRSVQVLQSLTWQMATREQRASFLHDPAFSYPQDMRAQGLIKSHLRFNVGSALSTKQKMHLLYRGYMIKMLGRAEPGLTRFLQDRSVSI